MMGFIDDYTIEQCCDILDNLRVPLNSDQRFEIQGEYPYYGANGVQGFISKYVFDDDLILIAEDGGNFEQFATKPIAYRVKGKCWVNNHAHVLKAKKEFSQDFIFYSLEHKNILFFIAGGTRSKLTQGELRKITLKHPEKKEADKIGEIFSMADTAIAQTEALIAKYQRIKTGLMQDLLTRGIDANGNIRSKATHKFVVKNGIEVPEEWEVVRLIDMSINKKYAVQTGPFGAQLHASDYTEDGIPVILIRNIIDGQITEKGIPRISFSKALELKRYQIKRGDIVFSRVGDVGRVAIATEEHIGWIISGQMLRVRLDNEDVYIPFLKYLTQSFDFKQALKKEILGTTRESINTQILENLLIRLPMKSEQIRIGQTLENIDNTIEFINNNLSKLRSLKTGLMQDLLSGRVRVKVNNG